MPANRSPLGGSITYRLDEGRFAAVQDRDRRGVSPTNPLGIKAGGDGGTTAAPAVMVSAILDALGELGVRDITMPATPYTVWTAICEAKARGGKG